MSMSKGSLHTVTQPVQGSTSMKSATPGMGTDGDSAGVDVKQMEEVSTGNPNLMTPAKDKVGDTGSKPDSMGAKVSGRNQINTPSTSLRKKSY